MTHRLLLQTFFGADDAANVNRIKANREPLLQALRARGLYHVSTLQMADETFKLLQNDSSDNKLYHYLRSIEVQDAMDLIDLTEASKQVIIRHINDYKVKELVTANLNLLLLNNIEMKQVLNENRNGGRVHSKFLMRNYHHLLFPLRKTVCGNVDVGVHRDRKGLYVCELNELSLKAGIKLYDRILLVNDSPVKTPEEFNVLVTQSNRQSKHHYQVNIVVARMNDHFTVTSDELVHELHRTLVTATNATNVGQYYNRRLSNINILLQMQERELLKVFNIIDGDGNGSIETIELQIFLEHSGLGGTRTARKMIDLADADGDGYVTATEFLSIMKLIQRSGQSNVTTSSSLYNVVPNTDDNDDIELEEGEESDKSAMMQEIDRYINELRQLAYWHELQRK